MLSGGGAGCGGEWVQDVGWDVAAGSDLHRDDLQAQCASGLEEVVQAQEVVAATDAHLGDGGVAGDQMDFVAGVDFPQDFVEALAAGL